MVTLWCKYMITPQWYPFSIEVAKQQRPMWFGDIISRVDEYLWLHTGQNKQIRARCTVHQGILGDIFQNTQIKITPTVIASKVVRVVPWLQALAVVS